MIVTSCEIDYHEYSIKFNGKMKQKSFTRAQALFRSYIILDPFAVIAISVSTDITSVLERVLLLNYITIQLHIVNKAFQENRQDAYLACQGGVR